ncbi:Cyclin-dependent kinase 2 [Rhizoclosmatium sp. JEL0117]|nr:Cyclin-dependent kinase 2 [Rhizoclosmatium sp. JEL0117]
MNFKLHTFNGVQYALPEPLTPVKVLGSGTFGLVIRATSPHYEKPVAIKIIRDTLGTAKEKANAFREIDILKTVRHQNIILIQDSFIFGQDVYIQTESLDSDLKMVLDSELIISEPNMLKMMKQIVSAVAYLHGICIMNRDLKPANILVDISAFHVKLCDFGSARLLPMRSRPNSPLATSPHPVPCFPDELLEIPFDDAFSLKVPTSELILPKPVLEPFPSELTREIETLWYRAPEILFGERMYTVSVDLWALGCVLVEIALRKPLFAANYPNGPTTTTIANNYPNPGPIATTAANNYPGPGPIAPITTNYPGPAPTTTCTSSVNGNNNGNGNSGNNGYIYGNAGTGNSTQPKKWWSSANRVKDSGVTVGLLVMASILF